MPKASRDKGARYEREVAEAFGAGRKGLTYKKDAADGHADVVHKRLFIQCKRRASYSVARFLNEVEASEQEAFEIHGAHKVPIVVMREDRGDSMVLMSLEEFRAMEEAADCWRRSEHD